MQENNIDWERVKVVLETGRFWKFVETLSQKHNTPLGAVGVNLSVGQKQRLLIARAVYPNPHFIFLDEATNALDANNEKAIMNNLKRIFIIKTVVVIAHRLNTIRNPDQIIVLSNGKSTKLELMMN